MPCTGVGVYYALSLRGATLPSLSVSRPIEFREVVRSLTRITTPCRAPGIALLQGGCHTRCRAAVIRVAGRLSYVLHGGCHTCCRAAVRRIAGRLSYALQGGCHTCCRAAAIRAWPQRCMQGDRCRLLICAGGAPQRAQGDSVSCDGRE